MIGGLLIWVRVGILSVGVGAFVLGRRAGGWQIWPESPAGAASPVDTSKAREVGARLGEAAANVANQAQDALATGRVTAKIKSKMALDERVKARNIHVDTNGSVVTLTGVVESKVERERAVQLAKETEGVTSVVDHLQGP